MLVDAFLEVNFECARGESGATLATMVFASNLVYSVIKFAYADPLQYAIPLWLLLWSRGDMDGFRCVDCQFPFVNNSPQKMSLRICPFGQRLLRLELLVSSFVRGTLLVVVRRVQAYED